MTESNFVFEAGEAIDVGIHGETLTVDYSVENTGNADGTQTITLDIDSTQEDSESQSLTFKTPANSSLDWQTQAGDAGNFTATVASDDDSAADAVSVVGAVPNKAVHRWQLDDVASGTVTDSIGSADGTVFGVSSVSGDYQGGSAGGGDGVGDYISTTALGSFGSNLDTDFAIAYTIDNFTTTVQDGEEVPCGVANTGSGGSAIECYIQQSVFNDGGVRLVLRDDADNFYTVSTDTGHVADGNKHRVLVNKTDNTGGGTSIYIDGSAVATSAGIDQGFGSGALVDFTDPWFLFARSNSGSADLHLDGTLDDHIIYGDSLTSGEITDDYNAQPWV